MSLKSQIKLKLLCLIWN